jgi:peptidoglycan/xylan/chitin deacetylase (PgdA/CDA1 family)
MNKKSLASNLDLPLHAVHQVSKRLGWSGPRVRVLLFHGIAPEHMDNFARHLEILSQSWAFLSPVTFEDYLSGGVTLERDSLLLTFDDGYESQRRAAEKVLNPFGIQAIFFAITEYAILPESDDWRAFVSREIWPTKQPSEIPDHWRNMNVDDLKFLIDSGHTIGSHSMKHARLSEVSDSEMRVHVCEGADELQSLLGQQIDHFAYPFGNLDSFSQSALNVARDRFQFIHTGLRGSNSPSNELWEIRRDSFEPTDSAKWVSATLNGASDWKYRGDRRQFKAWGAT